MLRVLNLNIIFAPSTVTVFFGFSAVLVKNVLISDDRLSNKLIPVFRDLRYLVHCLIPFIRLLLMPCEQLTFSDSLLKLPNTVIVATTIVFLDFQVYFQKCSVFDRHILFFFCFGPPVKACVKLFYRCIAPTVCTVVVSDKIFIFVINEYLIYRHRCSEPQVLCIEQSNFDYVTIYSAFCILPCFISVLGRTVFFYHTGSIFFCLFNERLWCSDFRKLTQLF